MLRRAALAGALIASVASVACNRSEGGDGAGSAPVASAGSARTASSGGSFSADLAKELAAPDKGAGSAAAAGAASDPKAGGGASDPKAGGDKAGASDPKAGGAKPASADTASGSKPGAGAAEPAVDVAGAPARGPVKVSAELAAIKLSLLPNWDRDLGQAGTFQYVVRIKGTQNTKTFTFHYGYDDPKAPRDHEQYKKYLQDSRALTGEIKDRQRGAAWFLEGTDAAGMPAFRYVVLYGGKQLICYGSLYKDAESGRLGDDRDQTLIQAKQICETLAL